MSTRIVRDVRIPQVFAASGLGGEPDGDCLRGDLVVKDGVVQALQAAAQTGSPRMVLPRLVDAHCHLDKCHTIHRLGDVGGDLESALTAQRRDKAHWTAQDLTARAARGLAECRAAGAGAVRSHIDWGDEADPPLAWEVLPELETGDMTVQWSALTSPLQMADAGFARRVASTIAATPGGVLGCFVLNDPPDTIRDALRAIFAEADRLGLVLDFHVDEALADLNGVEMVADAALAYGFEGPVLCGHAVALMNKGPRDMARIADKLTRAGITICALPTTNLYLQGRTGGTPDRRGITRLSELRAAGVPIITGSDNVADAFCPLGQHDPMAALHLACLTSHLDPPLTRFLPMITSDAARAMGLPPQQIGGARTDALLISSAPDSTALIAGRHSLTLLADAGDLT